MIDLHCHILPGVDDGSANFDVSCAMADIAARSGVDVIVATPHCNTRNAITNYRSSALSAAFRRLQEVLDEAQIPVRILPGAEVLMRGDIRRLLDEHKLLSINHSRYLLTEFYFDEPPTYMYDCLQLLQQSGYTPVIAHPERYSAVQAEPSIALDWFRHGCVLQLNKGSLLRQLGAGAHDTACRLLQNGVASLIGSDAHNFDTRSPDMSSLCRYLERRYPRAYLELLLFENPRRIINNQSLVPFGAAAPERERL